MIYFLFFSEQMGRTPSETYHYNLKPFTEIQRYINNVDRIGKINVFINLLGNVVCFMPLGFVIPILINRKWGIFRMCIMCCLSSVSIELLQLISKTGSCDIDDIIMNTSGGVLGYILFCICNMIYHSYSKGRNHREKKK